MTPPPLAGLGLFWKSTLEFFELGTFLKQNDPLEILRNKLNMKNIGTKSINMIDIMVYLAMFSTIINQILCWDCPKGNEWWIVASYLPTGRGKLFMFVDTLLLLNYKTSWAAQSNTQCLVYSKISHFSFEMGHNLCIASESTNHVSQNIYRGTQE